MTPRTAAAAAVLLCVLAVPAMGQLTGPGITWSGSAGNFAGTFGFECEPLQVDVTPGETVTLTVWGDQNAPFAVFASFGSQACVTVPGVANALLLANPVSLTEDGILAQRTNCGACPSGFEDMVVPVSSSLPVGTSITVQAVTFAGGIAAFSSAVTATVI